MNYSVLFSVLISIAIAGNCGVYSNGCEHLQGFSWSSISEYKVSCGFDGYVKKISKTMNFYPDNNCEEKPFITNTYAYSLVKKDGELDKAKYDITLNKATFKSSDVEELERRKVICTPKADEGKTYSLKDITCKILMINIWSDAQKNLGSTSEGYVVFDGNEDERTLYFQKDIYKKYNKVSSFLGCWEWWSITLLILGIIIIIALIVFLTIKFTSKKGKSMPKKK